MSLFALRSFVILQRGLRKRLIPVLPDLLRIRITDERLVVGMFDKRTNIFGFVPSKDIPTSNPLREVKDRANVAICP